MSRRSRINKRTGKAYGKRSPNPLLEDLRLDRLHLRAHKNWMASLGRQEQFRARTLNALLRPHTAGESIYGYNTWQ
jgi:hypothetical protein